MGTSIKVVNSGSSGNGFILQSDNENLIVEIGCRFSDYVEQLKENLGNVGGVIVSHRRHHDHLNPSTAKEFIRRGIDVFVGEDVYFDTTNATEFSLIGVSWLHSNFRNKVGGFVVQTFKAPHNVPNYGFLITTPTNERILFVTDTTGVNLRFRDINAIMVECNHDDDTLLDNIANHDVSLSHPEFHLGLDECKEFCNQNISASTKQVILIHLSQTNVNEQHAIDTVKDYCHFDNVAVAHKGDKFIIENDDF